MPQLSALPSTYPISDLRTRLSEIEAEARETQGPIILTRNGTSSLVVMDSAAYNEQLLHERAVRKLREAEIESRYASEALSHESVKSRIDALLEAAEALHA